MPLMVGTDERDCCMSAWRARELSSLGRSTREVKRREGLIFYSRAPFPRHQNLWRLHCTLSPRKKARAPLVVLLRTMPSYSYGALPPPGVWHERGMGARRDLKANIGVDMRVAHVCAQPQTKPCCIDPKR